MKVWYIAGQGAIGSFITYNATSSGLKCTQIIKNAKKQSPVTFHAISGAVQNLGVPTTLSSVKTNSIEYLVIPLKAYDVIHFLNQILPYLAHNACIILCHNGMGTIDAAKGLLNKDMDLFFCTTNHGLYKNEQGIFHVGNGMSQWSHVSGNHPEKLSNKDLSLLFNNCEQADDLQTTLWQKLLINCVINPLTAIHNVKNGALLQNHFRQDIDNIIYETVTIAQHVGIDLTINDVTNKVFNVIKNTSENLSSMNRDVQLKQKTEIDFINGYIVKLGEELTIPTPYSKALVNKVNTLTCSN